MTRFTLFVIRLAACVLVIIGACVATVYRAWAGTGDAWQGLAVGIALAWSVAPSGEDLRAFVGLMKTDD